jgi:hypothetical protein
MKIRPFSVCGPARLIAMAILAGGVSQWSSDAAAQIRDFEKAPQIPDVLDAVAQLAGSRAATVDTDVPGFAETYGTDAMHRDDHIQGISITPSGRIAISVARSSVGGNVPADCRKEGLLVISDAYSGEPTDELSWTVSCELSYHPSAVQAVGEIVAVADRDPDGARFFHLQDDGGIAELSHLDLAGYRGSNGHYDSLGITFNAREDRFYAFVAGGGVAPGDADSTGTIKLCRTDEGKSLLDSTTSFSDSPQRWNQPSRCRDIANVPLSGQGTHLVTQNDGRMFVIATFSSTSEPGGFSEADWLAYGAECNTETFGTAILSIFGQSDAANLRYHDIVVVAEIDYANGRAIERYRRDLQRTQSRQPCVHNRPAYRFGGAVAPFGRDGTMLGLWASRWNLPLLPLTDSFELAVQTLDPPIRAASTSEQKAYLFRENGTYYRYTDSREGDGVDKGYPLPTELNWQFGGREILGAVRWDTGYIYLFLEAGYYDRRTPAGGKTEGYPKKITDENWPGLAKYAEDIKAVVNWGNGKVYFFIDTSRVRDGRYVRYDIASNRVDQEARLVEGAWGILDDHNDDISAAVNWGNGNAYFFLEDGTYVRWEIASGRTARADTAANWPGVSVDEDITAAFRYLE